MEKKHFDGDYFFILILRRQTWAGYHPCDNRGIWLSQIHGIRYPVFRCSSFTIQWSIRGVWPRSYEDWGAKSGQWRIHGLSAVTYSSYFAGFFEKSLARAQQRWHSLRAHRSLPYDSRIGSGALLVGPQYLSNGMPNGESGSGAQRSRQKHYFIFGTPRPRDQRTVWRYDPLGRCALSGRNGGDHCNWQNSWGAWKRSRCDRLELHWRTREAHCYTNVCFSQERAERSPWTPCIFNGLFLPECIKVGGVKMILFIFTPILVEDSHLDTYFPWGWNQEVIFWFIAMLEKLKVSGHFFWGIEASWERIQYPPWN